MHAWEAPATRRWRISVGAHPGAGAAQDARALRGARDRRGTREGAGGGARRRARQRASIPTCTWGSTWRATRPSGSEGEPLMVVLREGTCAPAARGVVSPGAARGPGALAGAARSRARAARAGHACAWALGGWLVALAGPARARGRASVRVSRRCAALPATRGPELRPRGGRPDAGARGWAPRSRRAGRAAEGRAAHAVPRDGRALRLVRGRSDRWLSRGAAARACDRSGAAARCSSSAGCGPRDARGRGSTCRSTRWGSSSAPRGRSRAARASRRRPGLQAGLGLEVPFAAGRERPVARAARGRALERRPISRTGRATGADRSLGVPAITLAWHQVVVDAHRRRGRRAPREKLSAFSRNAESCSIYRPASGQRRPLRGQGGLHLASPGRSCSPAAACASSVSGSVTTRSPAGMTRPRPTGAAQDLAPARQVEQVHARRDDRRAAGPPR